MAKVFLNHHQGLFCYGRFDESYARQTRITTIGSVLDVAELLH